MVDKENLDTTLPNRKSCFNEIKYRKIKFENIESNLWFVGHKLEELGIQYKIISHRNEYEYIFLIPVNYEIIEDRYITDRYFCAEAMTILIPNKAKVYFWNHIGYTDGSKLIVSIREFKKSRK